MVWADALPNLLIGLREGLEAGLVVSILLAAVRRVDRNAATSPIWLGVLAAVVLALSFGAVLTFYRSVLPTIGQEALGGSLSVIAVALVTWMIFWMRRTARSLSGELRAKVADALNVSTLALALTAFLAVGREGVETALFLWTAAQASGQTVAPLIGAAIGVAAAVVLCVLLYRSAVRIRLDLFFNRTAVLLIIIAAGVLSYGLGDLQDAGLLPGHTWVAFDVSQHISASSWWVSIITGVTNLSPRMTWLQVIGYLCYLGTVLTLFWRSVHTPAVVKPETKVGSAPKTETPRRLARRPVMVAAVVIALVLPPVLAGALIGLGPSKSTSDSQRIEVTASACAPGWSGSTNGNSAGNLTFTVVNKSGHTAEVNLVRTDTQGIVAEIETLGPATQQTVSATLDSGDYAWRCLLDGLPTTTSASTRISGTASNVATPALIKQISAADLRPAVTAYNAYVAPKLIQLATQVGQIRTDLAAGSIPDAQRDWLPAQLTWEQVGAAYGSFGDLGSAIDGLPQRLPGGADDPGFIGLHRLEYGLWHGQSAATLVPVTDRLSADIATLLGKLPQVTVDPTDLPIRAHEILEDALRDHLTGMTDEGAGAGYPETLADVQGTEVVLDELAPLLNPRSPKLVSTAKAQLDDLTQALLATKVNGQWPSLSTVSTDARERVNAAIGAVLETLSVIPDLLEIPAHGQG